MRTKKMYNSRKYNGRYKTTHAVVVTTKFDIAPIVIALLIIALVILAVIKF